MPNYATLALAAGLTLTLAGLTLTLSCVSVPTDRATAEAAPPADRKVVNPAGLIRYAGRGPHSQRHQEDTIQGRQRGGAEAGHEASRTGEAGQSSGPTMVEACATGFAMERAPLKLAPGRAQVMVRACPAPPEPYPRGGFPM